MVNQPLTKTISETKMRPKLTPKLSIDEFEDWYWKKSELVDFCKSVSIPANGLKPEIEIRIKAFLAGLPIPKVAPSRSRIQMPKDFYLDTRIEEGWSCNPRLGAFFKEHCGNSFRFNYAVRNFIHTQTGRTLAEAIKCYQDSVSEGADPLPSLPQNELAAFLREYSKNNPNSSRDEIMAEWEQWKRTRKSKRAKTKE
jgi:hypothetical protein